MKNSVSKGELADQFGWTTEFLKERINLCPGLLDELIKESNYYIYQRVFTPKQVLIIFKHLGSPHELPK